MTRALQINGISLREFPKQIAFPLNEDTEITLGDLHGNALTLINVLMGLDIIEIGSSEAEEHANYREFVRIYYGFLGHVDTLIRAQNDHDYYTETLAVLSIYKNDCKYFSQIETIRNHLSALSTLIDTTSIPDQPNTLKTYIENTIQIIKEKQVAAAKSSNIHKENLAKDLKKYKTLIAQIKVINRPALRLLGDELADRGSCDYFTLLLFKKLLDEKLPLEVVVSNHTSEFIRVFQDDLEDAIIDPKQRDQYNDQRQNFLSIFDTEVNQSNCDISLQTLGFLMEIGLVKKDEIMGLAHDYFVHLKAISYSIEEERISIYTHGIADLQKIKELAFKFGVIEEEQIEMANDGKDEKEEEIIKLIDGINQNFQSLIAQERFIEVIEDGDDNPFTFIIKNRNYKACNFLIDIADNRKLHYVHGHHNGGFVPPEYAGKLTNLDNDLASIANMALCYLPQILEKDLLKPTSKIIKSILMNRNSRNNKQVL